MTGSIWLTTKHSGCLHLQLWLSAVEFLRYFRSPSTTPRHFLDGNESIHSRFFLVDKIRRGTKPAEILIEQPTKYDLVINLTAAKGFGRAGVGNWHQPAALAGRRRVRFLECS
jgi:hypothetical protein